ncbi:MAG: restriction endonuclease [Thermomicrobiales bacterium]
MAIPDYQSLMLPVLQFLKDGHEHTTSQCVEFLADQFGLSSEERLQLLPSGSQPVFANRVGWTTTYQVKAGLIERTARSRIRITSSGQHTLLQNPPRIDNAYLSQFPGFAEFRSRAHPKESLKIKSTGATPASTASGQGLSPDEQLEETYLGLRQKLAQELLERVKLAPPIFFERLVIDLLVSMGYGGSRPDAARAVGGTGDGGIDGIIKEDKLGLDSVYIQAKRWERQVGRPDVQAFAGSLEGQRARKGVYITTSSFSKDALDYVTRIEKRIVLIDGEELTSLMIDHGVGVADVVSYHIKRVDADYFEDS